MWKSIIKVTFINFLLLLVVAVSVSLVGILFQLNSPVFAFLASLAGGILVFERYTHPALMRIAKEEMDKEIKRLEQELAKELQDAEEEAKRDGTL